MTHFSNDIESNLTAINSRISDACRRFGRLQSEIRLVAVSKNHSTESIRKAFSLGLRAFGENYLTELETKSAALKELREIEWHYIGRLQSRKIPTLIALGAVIQTIETEEQVRKITKAVEKTSSSQRAKIFIQVNVENEAQKGGIRLADALPLARRIQMEYRQIELRGFMSIPSQRICQQHNFSEYVGTYSQLKEMAHQLSLPDVSLGMTSDLEAAIAAGSNFLRIGTGLFGARS